MTLAATQHIASPARFGKSDPFEVAVEHVAWCIRQRWTPDDVFLALGQRPPSAAPTWNDAIWVCARVVSDSVWLAA